MRDTDRGTFNPLTHFKVEGVPEPNPDGTFPPPAEMERDLRVFVMCEFSFFGKTAQAAEFADRLEHRLRVEVDASVKVTKIQIQEVDPDDGT